MTAFATKLLHARQPEIVAEIAMRLSYSAAAVELMAH